MILKSQSPGCGTWGSVVAALCKSLLISKGEAEGLETDIEIVINKSTMLGWEEWRGIKRLLLEFLVNDEAFEGRWQELWKRRLETTFFS
jgi:hypothetical protein